MGFPKGLCPFGGGLGGEAPKSVTMTHHPAVALAIELIRKLSITPNDAGCMELLHSRLQPLGFSVQYFDRNGTRNAYFTCGDKPPQLSFAGHTDVVPPGDKAAWSCDPFVPEIREGMLIGRGACDMKSQIAAFVCALESLAGRGGTCQGIALLITSDEEGDALDGTRYALEQLDKAGEPVWPMVLIGEPSANEKLGDTIRIGRRGSLTARVSVQGTQGHAAYPHRVDNPIHRCTGLFKDLLAHKWCQGFADFPDTSLQIVRVEADAGGDNVVPGMLSFTANWRYSPATNMEEIQKTFAQFAEKHSLEADTQWHLSGQPFHSPPGPLRAKVLQAITSITGIKAKCDAGGGTSDGRFLAPRGSETIELGLRNATAHKVDEQVAIADMETLHDIYLHLLQNL